MTSRQRGQSKPPKVSTAPMHERIVTRWHEHPLKVLGILASVVAVLSGIGPAVIWGISYYATHEELEHHKHADAVAGAWTRTTILDLRQLTLRNRVNDCNIKKESREKMSSIEKNACLQYEDEFNAATGQLIQSRSAAQDISREK